MPDLWGILWGNDVSEASAIPKCLKRMAGTTGLEPAASAVTGQRSNQLNYVPLDNLTLAGKPASLLAFPIFQNFHGFLFFHPVLLIFGVKWTPNWTP